MIPIKVAVVGIIVSIAGILTWSKLQENPGDKAQQEMPLPQDGDYDKSSAELVEYQAQIKDPYFHAPCPVSQELQQDILMRSRPIGFGNEPDKRLWESVVASMEEKRDIESFKKKIRDFILVLLKLQMPERHHSFGNSEAGDLLAYTRIAICDEVAIAHHHIKDGIDPVIGQDYKDNPNLIISKQDRILFENLYRSCRMTASNAYRYASGPFTRVGFYPTDTEWSLILHALKIDVKKPNEVVCTYKKRD